MMAAARETFLAERQQGLGGSDAGSLLSNVLPVEYGCERSLWARLSGIPTDYPDSETELMALGNVCESYVRRAYSEVTGRNVDHCGLLRKHATVESLQVHEDGIIHPSQVTVDPRTTRGVLEIKTIGREMMAKVNTDGLPIDYVLQLNHGMACHDLTWGEFALGMRDDILPIVAIDQAAQLAGVPMRAPRRPRIVHFEMERDEDIVRAIEEKAPAFWKTVGDPAKAPPRLSPDDPRCGRCMRKIWCQGAAVMENVRPDFGAPKRADLVPLAVEYQERAALLEQAQQLVTETQNKFKAALGPLTAASVPVGDRWVTIRYGTRQGSVRYNTRDMVPSFDAMRRAMGELNYTGIELIPFSAHYESRGMPSRPLNLSGLLPKKEKTKGETPEMDEEYGS